MMLRRLLISVLVFVCGYALGCGVINKGFHTPAPFSATVDMICLADSLEDSVEMWRSEISRRYPGAVGLVCHGGDAGRWMLYPDHRQFAFGPFGVIPYFEGDRPIPVEGKVLELKARFPGRQIVLVVCNPGHYRLNISGVSYALEGVWCKPDRELDQRSEEHPEDVGNIFEFVED